MDILRLTYATLLIFFIPGYTAVQAIFPRKGELDLEFDWLYRLALSMALSIGIVIFNGFFLNELTRTFGIYVNGKGMVQEPYLSLSLWSISGVLFVIGWYRGAYPLLGIIHPSLYREAPPYTPSMEKMKNKALKEMEDLAAERMKLKKLIKEYGLKERSSSRSMRKYYSTKKEEAVHRLEEIDYRMKELEDEIERGDFDGVQV